MTTAPIIITGAGQRLGESAALFLQQKGYKIVITYRTEREKFTHWQERGIDCIPADFSSNAGVQGFIKVIEQRYNSIRAIIHNASSWWPDDGEDDNALFDAMMQVHAKAPYVINKALASMLNGEKADIIHMTDFVAQVGSPKHIAYAASKAALENLTFSFARLLAPKVKVNAIAPALLKFNQEDSASYREKALTKSLLQNEPGWQESNDAILHLLQSDFITGRVMPLDGGRHLNFP